MKQQSPYPNNKSENDNDPTNLSRLRELAKCGQGRTMNETNETEQLGSRLVRSGHGIIKAKHKPLFLVCVQYVGLRLSRRQSVLICAV